MGIFCNYNQWAFKMEHYGTKWYIMEHPTDQKTDRNHVFIVHFLDKTGLNV
jgi:hypothetical protein